MKYIQKISIALLPAALACTAHAGFFDKMNAVLDTVEKVNNTIERGEREAKRTTDRLPKQQPTQQPSDTQQFPGNIFEPAASGKPIYIAGNWSSDWGDIHFDQKIDKKTQVVDKAVSGSYGFYKNSRIYGTMNGNVLEGYWVQKASTRDCGKSMYGSPYWGKIRFTFSGNQFTGLSGYCDNAPDKNSKWNGSK